MAGRPLKFPDAEELHKQIDLYFDSCDKSHEPYTITGLALYLDTTRQTLLEYEGEVEGRKKKDPAFADTIKRAKLKVENYAEIQLLSSAHPTGAIFALKNHGWSDKQELDHTGNLTVNVIKYGDKPAA